MFFGACVLTLFLLALLLIHQMYSALGAQRGIQLGAIVLVLFGSGAWYAMEWANYSEPPPPEDQTALRPVNSQTCIKCHESHYNSWHRTYHRTMTREATPEYVKGEYDGTEHHHMGVMTRMLREGDRYYMDTVNPNWLDEIAEKGIPIEKAGTQPRVKIPVDRLTGSHWFQQLLYKDPKGRYVRLPLLYNITEGRWIHVNGRFLAPDSKHYFARANVWNESCLYCHNTRPIMNPVPIPGQQNGFRTEVGELGISCEACHGAGERHVRLHQNPARRLAQRASSEPDPTIINPAKLSVERSADVCARCHGGGSPRVKEWNVLTGADPFLPGRDLKRFWLISFSEAEQKFRWENPEKKLPRPLPPEPLDGRYWGDGTPLTTAVEYQGMAMSACYEGGHGKMTCLSCHSMHDSNPVQQLKEGMRTNAACYSCHESYRNKLVEHTHHAADSQGSNCYNCHMPHQAYGVLDTKRTHRISIPRVRDSIGTGKPHACNLCHLDKSLGWTQEHLTKWYKTKPEPLSDDDRKFASSLLHLVQSDGRSRAVFAGAFAWPPAHEASGRDWQALLLTRILEHERYQAVRYAVHKGLRTLHGAAASDYDYQGTADKRAAQLRALRQTLENKLSPEPSRYPYLPLTAGGRLAEEVFDRLLKARNDPDVILTD